RDHSTPFVDGAAPPTWVQASPSARARALNSDSTTWCGARPERRRTCTVIPAAVASARTKSSVSPVSYEPIVSAGTSTSCTTKGRPLMSRATSTRASSIGAAPIPYRRHLFQRGQEPICLLGRPRAHPQASRNGRRHVTNQHPAVEEPLPHVAGRTGRPEQHEVGV